MTTELAICIVFIAFNLTVVICVLEALFRMVRALETLVSFERNKHPDLDRKAETAKWEIELSDKVKELLAKKKFIAVSPDLIREKAIAELKREGIIPPKNWQWEAN